MQPDIATRLQLLNSAPTAPFREQWVAAEAIRQLAEVPGLESETDRFGNIVLRLRRGETATSTATFVVHLDHPGFVFPATGAQVLDGTTLRYEARFEGRVRDEYFEDGAVRLFRSARDEGIAGRIVEFSPVLEEVDYRRIVIETQEPADGAVLAMWDVAPFEEVDGLLHARVCDDLAGAAVLIEMLQQLASGEGDVDVAVILTRAEEAGFCGLLCLLGEPRLPALIPEDTIFISVEISRETDAVRLRDGAVVRAGDRSSTFDGRITDTLAALATQEGIPARRALMDGGTCEATAFARAGWRTGGVCAPVRGYHNQDVDSERAAAEIVAREDLAALERLCRALALACNRGVETPPGGQIPFDRFIEKGRRELLVPLESITADPFRP